MRGLGVCWFTFPGDIEELDLESWILCQILNQQIQEIHFVFQMFPGCDTVILVF